MRAIKIHGTLEEIVKLEMLYIKILREKGKNVRGNKEYRFTTRLRAIILNMKGKTAPQIADILKVHRSNVSIWLRNWQMTRFHLHSLDEGHRSGRPSAMSDAQRQKLADILDSGPVAYGFASGVWTCPMVTKVIKEEFSIIYHPAHVSKILHKIGFCVLRPMKMLARADKTKQSNWVRCGGADWIEDLITRHKLHMSKLRIDHPVDG